MVVMAIFGLIVASCASDDDGATGDQGDDSVAAGDQGDDEPADADDVDDVEEFDADALLEAALEEVEEHGPLIVYAFSGRTPDAGVAFEELYGIPVEATRMDSAELNERIRREADAGNVQASAILDTDGPLHITEFIPQGYTRNYTPDVLVDEMHIDDRQPLQVMLWQPMVVNYNNEVYDECPLENWWQLTEEEWAGKFAIFDPQELAQQISFFASLVAEPDIMADAYESYYGEPLEVTEENAGYEFLVRWLDNQPLVLEHDVPVANAVGAAGQTDPPMGMHTLTRHREIETEGLNLAVCDGLEPFEGYGLPSYGLLVEDAPHPNAARLFLHYVLTEEGSEPWTGVIGGFSPNAQVEAHPDDPYGSWAEWRERLMLWDEEAIAGLRSDLTDFWLLRGQ